MALQKQNLSIPFAAGLDTKTDPFQVQPGKFLSLVNSTFTTGGTLEKRPGFARITALPEGSEATTLTTYQGNLISIGNTVEAYSLASDQWEDRGFISSLALNTQSLVRSTYSQSAPDVAISYNGLACSVFLDGDGSYKYQISDFSTSQVLAGITNLETGATLAKVFSLGVHFVIVYILNSGGSPSLKYIAIPVNNLDAPGSPVTISAQVKSITAGWDGYVANNTLYLAWAGSDIGDSIRVTRINSYLTQFNTVVNAGHTATLMSVTTDIAGNTPNVWVTAYDAVTQDAYTYAFSNTLVPVLPATQTINNIVVPSITSSATDGTLTIFYGTQNTYSYSSVRSDFLSKVTCTDAGVVGSPSVILRSVDLASESFFIDDTIYMLTAYSGALQPSYFLIDSSGHVIAKVAYSNGAGYATTEVLPSVTVTGAVAQIGYLIKDLIVPVNKSMDAPFASNIYTQTGINLVTFDFSAMNLSNVEIGDNLIIAGGITWLYDGVKPVELGFNVWPEDILLTALNTGGSMSEQEYFYQVTYEWTDGQGNIHRSAPSIPQSITLSAGQDGVQLDIPTLRLTYKTAPNGVRIVIYRWSVAQQTFYQVTSITSPIANNPAVDSITYTDQAADSAILGNNILYTTGGIVENIAPPSTSILGLFNSRVFLVDAENPNDVWYSKQVIPNTPVEMSDLFTIFIPPTSGAQGSTGIITALSPMDDKLIFFKRDAAYYMTGNGPDDTGGQNDFGNPVFITSTVGCNNQPSIAFIPQGLLFQSDKGIWLLSRNLSTEYLGSPVERYNSFTVSSAAVVPGTNQARFSITSGTSSCIYQGKHTFLTANQEILQETPGAYLDGDGGDMLMYDYFYGQWGTFDIADQPVLLSFITGWFSLTGIQGFQRAYMFYLFGQFQSPHKMNLDIAYDYNSSPTQSILITPTNYVGNYGVLSPLQLYGDGGKYGSTRLEQFRVFLNQQKCQAFQIQFTEVLDPVLGISEGKGIILSTMNLVVGAKKPYVPLAASQSVG